MWRSFLDTYIEEKNSHSGAGTGRVNGGGGNVFLPCDARTIRAWQGACSGTVVEQLYESSGSDVVSLVCMVELKTG